MAENVIMRYSNIIFLTFIFSFLFTEVLDYEALAFGEVDSPRPFPIGERTQSVRGRKHFSQDCRVEETTEVEEEEEEEENLKTGRNHFLRSLVLLHCHFLALFHANTNNILPRIVPWQTPFAERFNRISYQLKTIILII